MELKDLLKVISIALGGTLLLGGCSFQKNKAEPEPKIIINQNPKESASALEALQQKDMVAFERYISPMTPDQVNLYLIDGSTLLEQAVRQGHLLAVEMLLKKEAIPLKPSKDTRTTPYALAKKISEPIEQALLNKINTTKAEIVGLIRAKKYNEALVLQNNNYVLIGDFLTKESHFLDLVLEQEFALSATLKSLVITLLDGQPALNSSKLKILHLVGSDTALFKLTVQIMKQQNIVLEKAELVSLFNSFSIDVYSENVTSLTAAGFRSRETLANLQHHFLQKLIQVPEAKQQQLQQVYKSLQALKDQADDKAFCGTCVHQILDSAAFSTRQKEMVKLFINSSESAPEDFVQSLLGKLPPADLKDIVSILTIEMRKDQKSAFNKKWTVDEYKVLRSLGMRMNSEQTATLLLNLFERRHKGDKEASIILISLSNDWGAAHGFITDDQQHRLIREEFDFSFKSDLREEDLLSVIASIRTIEPKGILFGEIDGEKLWLNPFAVVKLKSLSPKSEYFELFSSKFWKNLNHLITDDSYTWFARTNSWSISTHDVVWLKAIKDETTSNKLVPLFKNPAIKKALENFTGEKLQSYPAIVSFLKQTDNRFDTADSKYRERYFPSLLLSNLGDGQFTIILNTVELMKENFNLNESSAALEFAALIGSVSSARLKDNVFEQSFLPYIKKQNPRFRIALEGHHEDYVAFLSGEFERDPLCKAESFNLYKQYCQKNKEEIEIYNRHHWPAFHGINRNSGLLARRIALSHFITHDRKTIEALTELAKIAVDSETIQKFFKENPWILNQPFDQLKPIKIPKIENEIVNPGLIRGGL